MDSRALAFTLVLSLLSGVLFGLIPALKYAGPRLAPSHFAAVGRTASQSRERHRVRNVLVVAQVAIALVLLVGAGLMIRTFQSIRTVEPGFTQPEHLQIAANLFRRTALVPEPERVARMQNDISGQAVVDSGCDLGRRSGARMPMEGLTPELGVVNRARRTDDRRPGRTPRRCACSSTPRPVSFKPRAPG